MKSTTKMKAFNSDIYLKEQIKAIKQKAKKHDAKKIYLEFGGKVFDDMHAARVLPGYYPDMKVRIIKALFRSAEIIFVVSGKDILRKRVRGDHKITYDQETLRVLEAMGNIKNVVITRVPAFVPKELINFKRKLERKGYKVHMLPEEADYINPCKDWSTYNFNDFVETTKKFVIIMSPGGGSGKFGVCINQLYHEMKRGITPFYIKFETFPVHDLPIKHPLNLAYMSASADFYDMVVKDPHKTSASSYNRDVENYELLNSLAKHFRKEGKLLKGISSATNMGVNRVTKGIKNMEEVEKESMAEIGRRLIRYKYEVINGKETPAVFDRVKKIITMI